MQGRRGMGGTSLDAHQQTAIGRSVNIRLDYGGTFLLAPRPARAVTPARWLVPVAPVPSHPALSRLLCRRTRRYGRFARTSRKRPVRQSAKLGPARVLSKRFWKRIGGHHGNNGTPPIASGAGSRAELPKGGSGRMHHSSLRAQAKDGAETCGPGTVRSAIVSLGRTSPGGL